MYRKKNPWSGGSGGVRGGPGGVQGGQGGIFGSVLKVLGGILGKKSGYSGGFFLDRCVFDIIIFPYNIVYDFETF